MIDTFEQGSARRLFIEEQVNANTAVTPSARRWHPTLIRWCLILHKKSSSAYKYIRESGMICLPSERTLCDYRSFKNVVSGVDTEEILNLAKSHPSSDFSLLIDEMNIKEGLVYNRQTGMLTGYVDSMDADSLFNSIDTERYLGKPATHAMCFMVRGLQSSVQTVVATFATRAITAEELYIRFWDVVASCELVGIKVRACVSDGASINRRFYKLHACDFPEDVITFRCINRYSADQRPLYFVSDTCHLMKTSRNCFENSGANRNSRRMVVSVPNLPLL